MINGVLLALIELIPRIRILGEETPGCPDAVDSCTPAALPASVLMAFDVCILPISSDLRTAADPVNADFLAVP